ncbi:hypothetical protein ABT381_06045 [Streptomyces sp. NPDC000151]|uniref:hypothetical protein n=1 Tax=Streptomyces sp. NPDC000151 TaxID=3154244 RepID=UPI0033192684
MVRTNKITIARTLRLFAAVAALVTAAACGAGPGGVRAEGSAEPTPVDLVRRVTGYTTGFSPAGGYVRPERAQRRAVAAGVGLLLDGRRDAARARLADAGYTVRTLTDRATGRQYAEVADRDRGSEAERGWGRVYVDLEAPARWSVQVPHPVADQDTERLGVGVLLAARGGVLVLAGAHRDAGSGDRADVAHHRDTVFDAVCAELVRRGLPGLQIHGFADSSAPEYDVIASTGRGTAARADGRALADDLRSHGFEVCRAWARTCPLAGETNVQGRRAHAAGVPFLHIEYRHGVRAREHRAVVVTRAMTAVVTRWSGSTQG